LGIIKFTKEKARRIFHPDGTSCVESLVLEKQRFLGGVQGESLKKLNSPWPLALQPTLTATLTATHHSTKMYLI